MAYFLIRSTSTSQSNVAYDDIGSNCIRSIYNTNGIPIPIDSKREGFATCKNGTSDGYNKRSEKGNFYTISLDDTTFLLLQQLHTYIIIIYF